MNAAGPALSSSRSAAQRNDSWATVVSSVQVAVGVREITLRPDARVGVIVPGSHIEVTVAPERGAEVRSYSLVDLGLDDGLLRIAVRLDPSGRGGSAWMHTVVPGTRLRVSDPISDFAPSPDRHPSVLLAAGIGITPIIGLARAMRDAGLDYRVVYAGRSRSVMAFHEHLADAHPGRAEIVETELPARPGERSLDIKALVESVPQDGTIYVCGPMRLLADVRAAWQASGRALSRLRFETFGTSGALPSEPFKVFIPSRGVSVDVPVGTSFLDALEDAGIEVMYDCLRGECGLCRVKVLAADGPIDHRDVFLSERQRADSDEMCTCVSRVAGSSITIEC